MLESIVRESSIKFINKWSLQKPVRTYCDIFATDVFTPCDGTVMYIGRDIDGYYSALIQLCADVVINLMHLKTIDVNTGDLIKINTKVGIAKQFCRVELGTLTKDKSDETIRIYDKQYYKRDPEQLTEENLGFIKFNHGETEYAYKGHDLDDILKLTKEQSLEYSQLEEHKLDE